MSAEVDPGDRAGDCCCPRGPARLRTVVNPCSYAASPRAIAMGIGRRAVESRPTARTAGAQRHAQALPTAASTDLPFIETLTRETLRRSRCRHEGARGGGVGGALAAVANAGPTMPCCRWASTSTTCRSARPRLLRRDQEQAPAQGWSAVIRKSRVCGTQPHRGGRGRRTH